MPSPTPSYALPYGLDKAWVRAAFDKAAPSYDHGAVLQREVGHRMLERLELIRIQPQLIVDVGAGTGVFTALLAKRYRGAHLVALDLAPAMLRQARGRRGRVARLLRPQSYLCADAETLPLASTSVDMIFSNLTLQWCNDLDQTFAEFRRVLKPGGLLMFTTFGPDTLKELRQCWGQVDGLNHVNAFIDMHDIGDALMRTPMTTPVMDVEHFTLTYADVYELMRDLKGLGAHNVTAGRARHLTGKAKFTRLAQRYEALRHEGRLPASYEVIYGHAWAPEANASELHGSPADNTGITKIPVSRIGRRAKQGGV